MDLSSLRAGALAALVVPLLACTLLAASPSATRIIVTCRDTSMVTFYPGENLPKRARVTSPTLGQTFGLVSGPRTTLEGDQYYETDVLAIEPGAQGLHYWIERRCAQLL